MASMYQISEESLNKIRADTRSRMQPWELELIEGKNLISEMPRRYIQVQGEAGFIELLAHAQLKSESGRN